MSCLHHKLTFLLMLLSPNKLVCKQDEAVWGKALGLFIGDMLLLNEKDWSENNMELLLNYLDLWLLRQKIRENDFPIKGRQPARLKSHQSKILNDMKHNKTNENSRFPKEHICLLECFLPSNMQREWKWLNTFLSSITDQHICESFI